MNKLRHILATGFFVVTGLLFAENPGALSAYRQGQELMVQGNFREAVYWFNKSIATNTNYAAAHQGAAIAYYAMEDWRRSIEHYQQVLILQEEALPARTGLAMVFIKLGQFDEALDQIRLVQKKDPGNLANNHAYGVYHYHLGRKELARSYFKKVVRLSPAYLQSWLGLAHIAWDKGRRQDALTNLERAAVINPDHPEIHILRGNIAIDQALRATDELDRNSFYVKARENFLSASRMNPDRVEIEFPLILLDLLEGKIESALQRSTILIERDPHNVKLLNLHAVIASQSGQNATAIQSLGKALKIDPADSLIRFKLESLLANNKPRSRTRLRAMSLYQLQQAKKHYRANNYGLFKQHLNRAIMLDPYCRVCVQLAQTYSLRTNNYALYTKVLRRQLLEKPNDPVLRFRLERALLRNKSSLSSKYQLYATLDSNDSVSKGEMYRRNPVLVYVFDPSSPLKLTYHTDGPAIFSRSLSAALREPGSVQAVQPVFRSNLEKNIKQAGLSSPRVPYIYSYDSKHLNRLEQIEKLHKQHLTHVVTGQMSSTAQNIKVDLQLIEKRSATHIANISLEAGGRDALYKITDRAASWIRSVLPVRGAVVRKVSGNILINLGRIDGLKSGDRLNVDRFGNVRAVIIVKDLDEMLSSAQVVDGKYDSIDPGDRVLVMDKK